ncbi:MULTISPECIES: response regulator [Clostridium]|uniref:Stage 0 sporulation protein A homolog n=1 Tax=Clostridium sulfidigenes TaxID=318464 RepID=A0A084JDT6_9CLOT|nr:response regulator transcription factor [Clostridium sulfidigenes]HAR85766.1 DNA-binding response regulator [Clostridium sp.]KEZ87120.1 transcriptional regulator [Clostridium sulfidigenes]MBE6061595.1 response regulator transcription factor [Clostridium sulfidigenes]HBA04370.1 DNA-binding response regulator [Clostridium sp.]HCO74071.1 DNA-binding response regulator [Clostridium sp.]
MQVDILIVEDEVKILEVLEAYLKKAGYGVITAINGSEAIYKYKQYNPRLIILDLMLPDISGEKICEIIRKESEVPIIMLTAKVEEESILKCFSLGTDDYITKPFSPKQVVARVNAVLKRALNYKQDNVLSFNKGDLVINLDTYEVRQGNNLVELTPSEFKILLALCESPKKVFSRGELLDRALGDDSDVYDRIIDSHIKNLRSKIEENSKNPKYILTVHGIGYKFGGE